MKIILSLLFPILLIASLRLSAQNELERFRDAQFTSKRVADAWKKYNDTLEREFHRKGLNYPPGEVYIRAFKSQNELELWACNDDGGEYRHVKTFRICSISGALGPKLTEGDRQVPEGFYFIESFNAASDYYLSLKLNYPNYADQLRGTAPLGGEIYLHGGCVTIGCLPMTDEGIKELYTACLSARIKGQENIPVHIFPTRLSPGGMAYLKKEYPRDVLRLQFWGELRSSYEYFEKYHRLVPVMYAADGRYVY